MNLSLSWVAAAAIPASQAIQQTASLAVNSASHFFGDLLHSKQPTLLNGLSEPTPPALSPNQNSASAGWSDRLGSLQTSLGRMLAESRIRLGYPTNVTTDGSFSITANGSDAPLVIGPEPIRSDLAKQLVANPDLTEEINVLAKNKFKMDPLNWLQSRSKTSAGNELLRIWVD